MVRSYLVFSIKMLPGVGSTLPRASPCLVTAQLAPGGWVLIAIDWELPSTIVEQPDRLNAARTAVPIKVLNFASPFNRRPVVDCFGRPPVGFAAREAAIIR